MGLSPTMVCISWRSLERRVGFLVSSAIAHSMVEALVSVPAPNISCCWGVSFKHHVISIH